MGLSSFLLFTVAGQRYGLPVVRVERIHPSATLTPLPGAPDSIEGILDLAGDLLPVLDIRRRLGLPPEPIKLTDRLIAVEASARRLLIRVDSVEDLVPLDPAAFAEPPERAAPTIAGLARGPEGLVLIQDPDRFLGYDEGAVLEAALASALEGGPQP